MALDLPQSPYPLAGEGRAVVDDVRRLGGVGILAHPDSPRAALAWHDRVSRCRRIRVGQRRYDVAHGEHVAGAVGRLFTVSASTAPAHWRPSPAIPHALFVERDQPTRAPQLALAAVDAHARIGWQRGADPLDGGRTLAAFPSYRASFGTFGLVVPWLDGAPVG